jgi:hypothetical protein
MRLIDLYRPLMQMGKPRHARKSAMRLSRPVHGGQTDPKKAQRVWHARHNSCFGEKSHHPHMDWDTLRRKHCILPKKPKHNARP